MNPGDKIKDNDPRNPNRILTIIEFTDKSAICMTEDKRRCSIKLNRIYSDGKPRRSGFDLIQTP